MKRRASGLARWALVMLVLGGSGACRFDGAGAGGIAQDLRSVDVIGDLVPPHGDAPPLDLGRDLASIPQPELSVPDATDNCGACPFGCESGSQICNLYDVSNISPPTLRLGSATLSIPNGTTLTIDTTTATVTGPAGPWTPPLGAGLFTTSDDRYVVFYLGQLTLVQGATLRVVGRRPLILLAAREVLIEGTVDASASGRSGGPGGGAGGTRNKAGEPGLHAGCAGAYSGDAQSVWDATGAAGGSFQGRGGQGGDGPLGANPCAPSRLRPLVGGTGGGGGARYGGNGGGGGGAVQISAGQTITVARTGLIHAGGGPGTGGIGSYDNDGPGSGGGGGSGGAILLEAVVVDIEGALAANGGGGGGGANRFLFVDLADGGDGQPARTDATAASGGEGGQTIEGRAGHGGTGAAAATLDGGGGTFDRSRGGGAGGGAGAIHLRSASGAVVTGADTLFTPAPTSDSLQAAPPVIP